MYLLDTNVISELRKAGSGRADVNVVQWASVVAPISLFISAMTIFELELGILQIERRDEAQAKILRHWVDRHVLKAFEQRILAVDVAMCGIACARSTRFTRCVYCCDCVGTWVDGCDSKYQGF
jgi:predicted nucleic acid-binding protein